MLRSLLSLAAALGLFVGAGFAADDKKTDAKPADKKADAKDAKTDAKPADKKADAKDAKPADKKPDAKGDAKTADKKPAKPKLTNAVGKVKKVDASTGAVTVTVKKGKKEFEDKDFTITDTVKFVIFEGESKTDAKGKDGLKGAKEGDVIVISSDEGGKIVSVRLGNPPKKPKK